MKATLKEKRTVKFDPVRAAALKALVLIDQGEQTDRAIELVQIAIKTPRIFLKKF